MSKKNELDTYIRKAKKGDKDAYRKIIELLYDEIYNLTAFIYDDDETKEKLTKHLFIKAYKNMPEYDSEECDIHLWMAREATKELYKVVCDREDEIFSNEIEQKEYNYDSIEDDDDLGEASAEFNEAFLTDTGFDNEEGCFASLTIGEKIIYLLYCYEGYSVDEIESIMDIDSSFITSEIASMRDGILAAYAPIKAENADENEDALADESDAVAAAPVSSEDDDYEDEDDYSDPDYDDEDDIDILDDEKPVRKAARSSSADKKKYAIGGLRLTEKELKGVIVGVFAAVVLIVVIVVVMVVSGHNKDNGNSQTTKASVTATKTTPAASTKASTEAATTEEETTTTAAPRRPQSGTQPDVNISTTAAPTEAPTQPSTEAQTTKPTQKPTEATTAAKETTKATEATTAATQAAPTQASTAATQAPASNPTVSSAASAAAQAVGEAVSKAGDIVDNLKNAANN